MAIIQAYTTAENDAIQELRNRMADEMKPNLYEDTHMFYRFLKARDFNINEAEVMLRKHLAWRKEKKVDTILTDFTPPEVVQKYFTGGIICFDKEGSPVKYFSGGNFDPKGIRKCIKFPTVVDCAIHMTETEMAILKEQSKKFGYEVPGSVYIMDCHNFSFAVASDKKTLEHLIYAAKMYQDNYPERLKALYVINASIYFTTAFNIIKAFLSVSVINKIRILSSDTHKTELLKFIDADELPAFLGGNKTDPDGDPLCKTFVQHAGRVPEKYFVNKDKIPLSKEEGIQKLIIPRSSFSEIELEVIDPGSLIEWEFETKCRDIAFGLFYKEVIGDVERIVELVPLQRLDTDDFSEAGVHKCMKAGTYIVLFDNSYSWLRSKEIYYRAKVTSFKDLEKGED